MLDRDRSGEVRARARDCAPAPPCTGACLRVCRAAFHRQGSGREARRLPRGRGGPEVRFFGSHQNGALTETELAPRRGSRNSGSETGLGARHRKPTSPRRAEPRRRRFPCLVSVRPRACAAARSGRGPALCTGIEDKHRALCAPEPKTITRSVHRNRRQSPLLQKQEPCFLPSPSDTHLGPVCCSQSRAIAPSRPQTALPRCPLPSPTRPPTGPPRSLAPPRALSCFPLWLVIPPSLPPSARPVIVHVGWS